MLRKSLFLSLCGILLLSACDASSPTATQEADTEAALEQLAVEALDAVEKEGYPLPSLQRLLRETYQTIRSDREGNAEGLALLRRARNQAVKAQEAREAGDLEAARAHAARSQALTLDAILSVLGEEVVDHALAGVDQALARLEARFAGKTLPDRFQNALNRAKALSEKGHEAREGGRLRVALSASFAAADLVRAISPRYQAFKAIRRASRAFDAAWNAVKADVTEGEAEALREARKFLAAAKEAYVARSYREAVLFARESATISLRVLEGRS
jgi:hypothetical protein